VHMPTTPRKPGVAHLGFTIDGSFTDPRIQGAGKIQSLRLFPQPG
jgi:hypothetical protein